MNHYFGLKERDLSLRRIETPIYYNPAEMINGHMLICGMSGVGKSTQSVALLTSAAKSGTEIDVFDPHAEFHNIPNATPCWFSQATGYGYNPLILNTDIHTGGVNSQINFFVKLIKEVTPQFGVRQEAALRYLLADTYASHDIIKDDRDSWSKLTITDSERQHLLDTGRGSELVNYYPTLEDLKDMTIEKINGIKNETASPASAAFAQYKKLRTRFDFLLNHQKKLFTPEKVAEMNALVDDQEELLFDAFRDYVQALRSGTEMEDSLKYDSSDVLTSIYQRIELINKTGMLNSNTPPFGDAQIRVHQIKSATTEEQRFYVKLRLQAIFEKYKQMEPIALGSPLRQIIMIDEAHIYFRPEPDDILNIIVKEGRKFGIGLWCSSQEATSFPESFVSNCGTTVILGIPPNHIKKAERLFAVPQEVLDVIQPQETIAVRFARRGVRRPIYTSVAVPNPSNPMGRAAITAASKPYQSPGQQISLLDDDEDC